MLVNGILSLFLIQAVATSSTKNDTRNSISMAESIISRNGGIFTNASDASEPLQAGIVQKAFRALTTQYPNTTSTSTINTYITHSADSLLPIFSNTTALLTYPLDRFSSATTFLGLHHTTQNPAYTTALTAQRSSLDLQPRNRERGLWYYVYPNWSYLDGLFSLAPFYAQYTASLDPNNSTAWSDLALQFNLLWSHCRNNATGLLVHGYDAERTAVWADPVTGASPHVWGRSLGWFVMALVDTLEVLDGAALRGGSAAGEGVREREVLREDLAGKFREVIKAVVGVVDGGEEGTGAWWQVLDQGGRGGNYVESSASSMFVYGILKGVRLGLLGGGEEEEEVGGYVGVAVRAYEYVAGTFVVEEGGGVLGWNGTVSMCSLNSTASYGYYVGRPILYNSVLGSAAFVLASLEVERRGL